MSSASQIPQATRGAKRTTRGLADENATRRTTRITRPAKDAEPLAAKSTVLRDVPAGSKAVETAAQKRKREALGEVTNNNKGGKSTVAAKGKDKLAAESVVVNGKKPAVRSAAVREPLRPIGRKNRAVADVPEEADDGDDAHLDNDDAMHVDAPNGAVRRASSKVSTTATTTTAAAARRTTLTRKTVMTVEVPSRPRPGMTRVSRAHTVLQREEEVEEEEEPQQKKRRTSSEADELEQRDLEVEIEAHVEELPSEAPAESVVVEEENADAGWEDLDADDHDDPLMVSEYVVEIFQYLKVVEQTTMPNPTYMDAQKELGWSMRGVLTDWLIQVHARFRFLPETLFLAVNMLDRFLSARVVSVNKLQLVGVTCLFVAAKHEEIFSPSMANFIFIADNAFTEEELLQAERYLLKTLDWNLSYPSPINFLRRASKADEYNIQVRTVAKFFLEISLVEWRLLHATPSLLGAASIWLGRLVLDQGDWTPNLIHYSGYSEKSLMPVANLMLNYILKAPKHENFYKKYASRKFYKASTFVRSWALQRWSEGTVVCLIDELPLLRAASDERRARGEVDLLGPEAA